MFEVSPVFLRQKGNSNIKNTRKHKGTFTFIHIRALNLECSNEC